MILDFRRIARRFVPGFAGVLRYFGVCVWHLMVLPLRHFVLLEKEITGLLLKSSRSPYLSELYSCDRNWFIDMFSNKSFISVCFHLFIYSVLEGGLYMTFLSLAAGNGRIGNHRAG